MQSSCKHLFLFKFSRIRCMINYHSHSQWHSLELSLWTCPARTKYRHWKCIRIATMWREINYSNVFINLSSLPLNVCCWWLNKDFCLWQLLYLRVLFMFPSSNSFRLIPHVYHISDYSPNSLGVNKQFSDLYSSMLSCLNFVSLPCSLV